jgi:hypothetical protein
LLFFNSNSKCGQLVFCMPGEWTACEI